MKKLLLLIVLITMGFVVNAQVYVKGYTKKNGTYVQGYYRSSPDHTPTNNYSYPGNINPYTSKEATGDPYTYTQKYNSFDPYVSTYVPPPYIPENNRVYYIDDLGNKSIFTVLIKNIDGIKVNEIYNLNVKKIGFMHEYSDGEKYIYDINYELIKIVKAKNQ